MAAKKALFLLTMGAAFQGPQQLDLLNLGEQLHGFQTDAPPTPSDHSLEALAKSIASMYSYAKENQLLKAQNLRLMQQIGILSSQGQTLMHQASSLSQQLNSASSLHKAYDDKTKLLVDELVKQHQYGVQCHQHVSILENVLLESEELLREVHQFKQLITRLKELSLENAAMTSRLATDKSSIGSLSSQLVASHAALKNATADMAACSRQLALAKQVTARAREEAFKKSAETRSVSATLKKKEGVIEALKKQILLSDVEECRKTLEQAESTLELTKGALSDSQLAEAQVKSDLDVVKGRLKAVELSAAQTQKGNDRILDQANNKIASLSGELEREMEKVASLKMDAKAKEGNQCLPVEHKLEKCTEQKMQLKLQLKMSRAEANLLKQTVAAGQTQDLK